MFNESPTHISRQQTERSDLPFPNPKRAQRPATSRRNNHEHEKIPTQSRVDFGVSCADAERPCSAPGSWWRPATTSSLIQRSSNKGPSAGKQGNIARKTSAAV